MEKFMEILVSILAIIGLASVVNHMMHCEEGCCLCSLFKVKKEELRHAGEKTTQQMREDVKEAGEKASTQIKTGVKQAAEKVAHSIKVEDEEHGSRYGSTPIRY